MKKVLTAINYIRSGKCYIYVPYTMKEGVNMNFIEQIQQAINKQKTLTTNGAIAYSTSGKALLDFNFHITALRNMKEMEIVKEFLHVYVEDPKLSIIYLFYLRDILEGMGERRLFKVIMKDISKVEGELVKQLIPLIPQYGRWDDLLYFLDEPLLKETVLNVIKNQLETDLLAYGQGKDISLLAKWLPSINTSNQKAVKNAKIIKDYLGLSSKQYRQVLKVLRDYIDVVECKMTQNQWNLINYEQITSHNQLRYSNSFMLHDQMRRTEYLQSLKQQKAKINAKAVNCVDIVNQYWDLHHYRVDYNETYEQLWKNMKISSLEDTLVIRDGSGSMYGRPLIASTALAIALSSHNQGFYKDKFITFSSRPEIVDLSSFASLQNKIRYCATFNDYTNTNLYKTLKLILDTAMINHLSQEELPGRIVIISDMQFDGHHMNLDHTLLELIQNEFEDANYQFPRIIFWNVNEKMTHTIPLQKNELGLTLVSSYSNEIVEMIMADELDPYQVLLERLNQPRYEPIIKIIDSWKFKLYKQS